MRKVVIVAFPDVQTLDVVGPAEVFSMANSLATGGQYDVEVVASHADALTTGSGLKLVPHRSLAAGRGPICGVTSAPRGIGLYRRLPAGRGRAARRPPRDHALGRVRRPPAPLPRRRRRTGTDLRARRRRLHVAGVTAGIDLALALVEDDLGAAVARDAARWLVLFLRRPGTQAQFSSGPSWQPAERPSLRDLQSWIAGNLTADLSVPALAERAFMSPRNFARAFRREVGVTPGAYVESVRLERARAELEAGDASVDAVAALCGFGTVETMRRAFQRRFDVNPAAYRSRFRTRGGTHDADRHPAV